MLVKCKFAKEKTLLFSPRDMAMILATVLVLFLAATQRASAQAYFTFTPTDIGTCNPPIAYSSTAGPPPTYTVDGGGAVIGGTADNCAFVSLKQAGNIEFTAKITSQTSSAPPANPYAVAGVMVRQDNTPGSPMAVIGVSPKNGVNFTYRPNPTASIPTPSAVTILGPSSTAPVWVRLAISGNKVGGYTSSDGLNWTLVGESSVTFVGVYNVGFAVAGYTANNGTHAVAAFTNVSIPVGVPQANPNFVLWLRADSGLTANAGVVQKWLDQSGSGYVGSVNSPPTISVVSNAVNGLPGMKVATGGGTIAYNPGLADFSQGLTEFAVSVNDGLLRINVSMATGTQEGFLTQILSGSSVHSSTQGGVSQQISNSYSAPANAPMLTQVLQVPGPSAATAYLTINGNTTTGPVKNLTTTRHTLVQIPDTTNATLCEVLLFNKALTQSEIANINAYFYSKYGVGTAPVLAAPIFNPPAAKYAFVSEVSPPTVSIQSTPGTVTYFTTDGSPVSLASPVYTAPIPISQGGMEIQAASAFPGSTTLSPIGNANFQVSPTFFEVPTAGRKLWLSADAGVTANASGQISNWYDVSGNNWSAIQPVVANMPVLGSLLLNQSPYITFNGGTQNFSLPSNTIDFSTGSDFFMLASVNSPMVALERLFDFGVNANTTNDLHFMPAATTGTLRFGTSASALTSTSTVFTSAQPFQLLEGQQLGTAGGGNINVNLVNKSTSVSIPAVFSSAARPYNYIGMDTTGTGHPFAGAIAEFLVYNTVLSSTQQQYLYSYFANKYWMIQPPNPAATLTFVPPSGSHLALNQGQAAVVAPLGVTLHYTISPTVMPTVSSPVLNGPITPTSNGTMQLNILPVAGGQPIPASAQSATYTTP